MVIFQRTIFPLRKSPDLTHAIKRVDTLTKIASKCPYTFNSINEYLPS